MLDDFDDVNAILHSLADEGMIEPLLDPTDDPTVEMNFWDWADIVGIVDEFAPESMVDEDGKVWYVT